MPSVRGVIDAVQEGRFRLIADDGSVWPFVLSRRAAAEPQDLPPLQSERAHVRVAYHDSGHLIATVAESIDVEE